MSGADRNAWRRSSRKASLSLRKATASRRAAIAVGVAQRPCQATCQLARPRTRQRPVDGAQQAALLDCPDSERKSSMLARVAASITSRSSRHVRRGGAQCHLLAELG